MRKLLLITMLFTSFMASAQVKISDLPTYTGTISPGAWVPIVVSGITRKYDVSNLATNTAVADSLAQFVRLQTQAPMASISGGYFYERHAIGTFTASLGWSAGRQAAGTNILATNPLSSIIVAGTSQTFSQPAAGSSVSGSQSVTVTYNSNTTFTDTVKTTDGKSAIGYTYFSVYDKRFVGWAATSTPTNSEILAAVYQDNYGGTVPLSTVLAQLGSDKYLFIVNTATINTIAINGFPSTAAFTLDSSKTFTNASGGTFTGYISVSINPFGSVGTTTLNVN